LNIGQTYTLVALLKCQNVLHIAAAPLINRLVVVTDYADLSAKIVKKPHDGFLDWVYVLVLIDDVPRAALPPALSR
jgi:hypothetical protein